MKKTHFVRITILAATLVLQLSALCFHSRAAAGDVDLSFDPGSGVNGTVNAVVVQPDGKVIIGGQFTTVKGFARPGVARLNADGSGDSTFNPSADAVSGALSLGLQADGKVLVWGYPYGMSRLNSDGSLDADFNASIDPDNEYVSVDSIAVQPDGRVLICGGFYSVNGITRIRIARLNANGSLDSTFDPGADWNERVVSIALQSDGKVLVGGQFSVLSGTNRFFGIARLSTDGSLDTTFTPDGGADGVQAIAVQPDGKVLIGGSFTSANHAGRVGIARLNPNGTLDASFDTGTGANGVYAIALQSDGKALIGGEFVTVNGTKRDYIARLNSNGGLDASFNGNSSHRVGAIAVQSDGKPVIAGEFTAVNGIVRSRIARLNADGSPDGSFDPGSGIDAAVSSVVVQPDGKVLVGGSFRTVRNLVRSGIARLNADGSGDTNFNPGTNVYEDVKSIVLQPDGKVLITRTSISRINADGSFDGTFSPDLGVVSGPSDYTQVDAVALQPDGKVLVSGSRIHYECNEFECLVYGTNFLTRLDSDGSRDATFNSWTGPNDPVRAIAVQSDGKVFIGGEFHGDTNRPWVARLLANGSLDESFNSAAVGGVVSIALQPDGKVLIAGIRIARLNPDGNLDSSFNPSAAVSGGGGVLSLALQPDGKVVISGSFTTVNGTKRNGIARLNANGSLDGGFNPSIGTYGVSMVSLQPDGNVVVGGDFLAVTDGVTRSYLVRLYGDFSTPLPSLKIARSNSFVIVSWPAAALSFQLQESTNFSLLNAWSPVAQPRVTNAAQISVTVSTGTGPKFFRLRASE